MIAKSSTLLPGQNLHESKRFSHYAKSAKWRIQVMVNLLYFCSLRKITLQDDAERRFNG